MLGLFFYGDEKVKGEGHERRRFLKRSWERMSDRKSLECVPWLMPYHVSSGPCIKRTSEENKRRSGEPEPGESPLSACRLVGLFL